MIAAGSNDAPQSAPLRADGLTVSVANRVLVRDLNVSFRSGSVTCILGCNGAGKSLTLHTLAGVREPQSGRVCVEDRDIATWPRRQLALQLGLLTQTIEDPFPATALAAVLVGRHPHIGFWNWESEQDEAAARAALERVGVAQFESREIDTLSGGERRRVAIATLLAQNPRVMLLDEPINHLDPHHQIDVLRLMKDKATAGHTIVMSLHDAGLAARYADDVLLLFGDGHWLFGPIEETLTAETISRLYGTRMQQLAWPSGRTFVAVET